MRIIFFALAFLLASKAYGFDPKKCFSVTHGAGLVKYEFPGYLSSAEYMTKKYGTTGGTTQYSMQNSTAMVDPSVTSGRVTSTVQFSTSFGGCSYYSYKREQRLEYIARNKDQVIEQIAKGSGEHIKSLYYFSSCSEGLLPVFQTKMQANLGRLILMKDVSSFDEGVEEVLSKDPELKQACIDVG